MTPSPDERTTLRWRIAAILTPEIIALSLTIVVVAMVVLAVLGRFPRLLG